MIRSLRRVLRERSADICLRDAVRRDAVARNGSDLTYVPAAPIGSARCSFCSALLLAGCYHTYNAPCVEVLACSFRSKNLSAYGSSAARSDQIAFPIRKGRFRLLCTRVRSPLHKRTGQVAQSFVTNDRGGRTTPALQGNDASRIYELLILDQPHSQTHTHTRARVVE